VESISRVGGRIRIERNHNRERAIQGEGRHLLLDDRKQHAAHLRGGHLNDRKEKKGGGGGFGVP